MVETLYRIGGCPVSIALLTDTHDTDPAPVLASVRAHAPSLILLAGDFVHGRNPGRNSGMENSPNAVTLLTACAGLAPTFVSIGNHETRLSQADAEIIRSTGVTLLDNDWTAHDVTGGGRLIIGGLSSGYYTARRRRLAAAPDARTKEDRRTSPEPETGWLAGFAAADGYHILLMHHPEYIRRVPPSVELALSGHAHGGQWRFYDLRIKKWRGVYAPDQGLLPELTGGVVDGRLVISRGLGNTAGLPRINNPPEIVYIEGRG